MDPTVIKYMLNQLEMAPYSERLRRYSAGMAESNGSLPLGG